MCRQLTGCHNCHCCRLKQNKGFHWGKFVIRSCIFLKFKCFWTFFTFHVLFFFRFLLRHSSWWKSCEILGISQQLGHLMCCFFSLFFISLVVSTRWPIACQSLSHWPLPGERLASRLWAAFTGMWTDSLFSKEILKNLSLGKNQHLKLALTLFQIFVLRGVIIANF